MKLGICLAGVCALALVGAGCGGDDDNDTLSYDDTGTEISAVCDSVNFEGINGEPKNDAAVLERIVPDFESAVQDVRELDVNEELASLRDDFASNADEQIAIIDEAQALAESGDKKAYQEKLNELEPLDKESNDLANELGADGCLDDE
jgi:hypothetical protein